MAELFTQRGSRAAQASVAAAFARLVGLVSSLLALPAISRAGGADALTVFLLATTLPSLLPASDLGLGGVLQTETARWSANPTDEARRHALRGVLGSFLIVSTIVATVAVVLSAVGLLLGAGPLLLGEVADLPRANASAFVAIAAFSITVPLQVGVRTLAGLQRVTLPQLAGALGSISLLVGVLVAAARSSSPLPFVIAWGVSQLLASSVVARSAIRTLRSKGISRPRRPGRSEVRSVISSARWWVIIALCAAASYSLDPFIVARYVGATAAAQYSVGVKLLAACQAVLLASGGAVWSRATVLAEKREYQLLNTTTRRTARYFLLIGVVAVGLLQLLGPVLFSLLSSNTVECNRWAFLFQGAVTVVIVGLSPFGLALAGIGVVRTQALIMVVMTIVNLVLSFLLVRTLGTVGPALGSVIAQLACFAVPLAVLWRRHVVSHVGLLANAATT
jgi:O-antigen/teichoic acid export membrane protein